MNQNPGSKSSSYRGRHRYLCSDPTNCEPGCIAADPLPAKQDKRMPYAEIAYYAPEDLAQLTANMTDTQIFDALRSET
jgi:hypothetical protein